MKKLYSSNTPSFRRGDTVVLLFAIYDNGVEYNIDNVTKAQVHQNTCNNNVVVTDCSFVIYKGKRHIKLEVEPLAMVELGFVTMVLTMFEGDTEVSIQPFNVLVYNDYKGGAGSFVELIQDLQKEIEALVGQLNDTVKLADKGVPNGVASLDENGKIPMSQMPNEIRGFEDHIEQTVYKDKVHGFGIDEDGLGIYKNINGDWVYIGFADTEGGGGSGQFLKANLSIENSIVTIEYEGTPTVVLSKWAVGDRDLNYFMLNGTTFTGTEFVISQVGLHTFYYKDSNGNEYTKLFNVTQDQLLAPDVSISVEEGIVTITTPPTLNLSIKKWDNGVKSISYFQYNGHVITGNSFVVTQAGQYSIYIKTVDDLEYVYVIIVTEEDLPNVVVPSKPITELVVGDKFLWENKEFILLDQDNNKSLIRALDIYRSNYDINASNNLSTTSTTNIGYKINNDWLSQFTTQLDKVLFTNWGTGFVSASDIGYVGSGQPSNGNLFNLKLNITMDALKAKENTRLVSAKFAPMSMYEFLKYSTYNEKYDIKSPADSNNSFNNVFNNTRTYVGTRTPVVSTNNSLFTNRDSNPPLALTSNSASSEDYYIVGYVDNSFICDLDIAPPTIEGRTVENAIYLTINDNVKLNNVKWAYGEHDYEYFETNGTSIYTYTDSFDDYLLYTPQIGKVTVYADDTYDNKSIRVFEIFDRDITPVTINSQSIANATRTQLGLSQGSVLTVSDCKSVIKLDVTLLDSLTDLIHYTNLESLSARALVGNSLTTLNGIQYATKLKSLWIVSDGNLNTISNVASLNSLDKLILSNLSNNTNVSQLPSQLTELTLQSNGTLIGINNLSITPTIELLNLKSSNLSSSDLPTMLINSSSLINLSIESPLINNTNFLSSVVGLESLTIKGTSATKAPLTTINNLGSMSNLHSLVIEHTELNTLNGIQSLLDIEILVIANNKITSISQLQNLNKLKQVVLQNNLITSFNAINRTMSSITLLYLTGNTSTDYPPKSNYPSAFYANSFDW